MRRKKQPCADHRYANRPQQSKEAVQLMDRNLQIQWLLVFAAIITVVCLLQVSLLFQCPSRRRFAFTPEQWFFIHPRVTE